MAHLGACPVIGGALRMPTRKMGTRLLQAGLIVVALVAAVAMSVFPTDRFVIDTGSSRRADSFDADAASVMLTPVQALQTVYGGAEKALLIDLRPELRFSALALPRVRNLSTDALSGLRTSPDVAIVLAGSDDANTARAARELRREKSVAAFAVEGGFGALQSLLLEPLDARSLSALSAQERALVKRLRVAVARARPQYTMYLGASGLPSLESPVPRAGGFQPPMQPAQTAPNPPPRAQGKAAGSIGLTHPEEGC